MRDVAEAFRDAITGATVYAAGKVPNKPTYPYVVVTASTPDVGDYSLAALSGSRLWRFTTLYVGNSEDSALWVAEKVYASLLDQRLTIDDLACSPIKREAGRPITPDPNVEGVSSGADTWTFITTSA